MCLWWRIRVPPPSDFLCAKQMTTLCSPIPHKTTLCVKTDKAFATPNSACIVEPATLYTLRPGFSQDRRPLSYLHLCIGFITTEMNLKRTAGGPKLSFNNLLQDLISDYICILLSSNPSLTGTFSMATSTGDAPAILCVTGTRLC